MFYTIYNETLSATPSLQQINLPVPLQAFKLDFRHDTNGTVGGLVLEYWGLVLTEDVNGLPAPKLGYTKIDTGSPLSTDNRVITTTFSGPVGVVKFSASSTSGRKLFLAVVAEIDYGMS